MVQRKTNRGKIIDMESLLAQHGDEPAMGNMNVNGRGDLLGKSGQIVQKAEDRARAYYRDNPKSSTAKSSLRGPMPDQTKTEKSAMDPELKTAKAQKTEADQSVMNAVEPQPVQETKTIVGYKEVEQANGDIEMVPIYEDDWSEDE